MKESRGREEKEWKQEIKRRCKKRRREDGEEGSERERRGTSEERRGRTLVGSVLVVKSSTL